MLSDEITAALRELADERKPFSPRLLRALSGPNRAECQEVGRCLASLSAARRREALAAMVEQAEDDFRLDFVDIFRACLSDADPQVRCSAIEGLWEDERPDLIAPLMRLLESDPDALVRAAAATGLGRYVFLAECEELDDRRARPIRELLARLAGDTAIDIDVRRRALESLAYVNDASVRRLIDSAYHHGDQRLRESALFAMGRSADRVWSETVLADLTDEAPAIRLEAARAAGELRLSRAVSRLIEMVDDLDREVQGMAVWALGQVGGRRAQQMLRRWADSEDEALAVAASDALAEMEFADRSMDLLVYDADEAEMVEADLEEGDDEADADEEIGADDDLVDEGDEAPADAAAPANADGRGHAGHDHAAEMWRRGLLDLEDDGADEIDEDVALLPDEEDDEADEDEEDDAARRARGILGLR